MPYIPSAVGDSSTEFTIHQRQRDTIVSNGKRFIAYDLIKRLKDQNNDLILNELNTALNNTERKEGKLHSVFETPYDWKECRTEKFTEQELAYIHWNSCKGNKLVEIHEHYNS